MKRLLSFFCAFFVAVPVVVTATVAPVRASSPFCAATMWMIPWNVGADAPLHDGESADYALELYVAGKKNVAARVTMITGTQAYSVSVPRTALYAMKGETDMATDPILVHFDRAQTVKYAFVDGVGVDGASVADCPSDVNPIAPYTQGGAPQLGSNPTTLKATYLQDLPKLSCGSAYIEARQTRSGGTIVGHYGNAPRTTTVRVYLDSDGNVLRTELAKSSGVEGLDDTALGYARMSRYAPAEFLCTPVVSEFLMDYTYDSGGGE